jgi:hypothetical protein
MCAELNFTSTGQAFAKRSVDTTPTDELSARIVASSEIQSFPSLGGLWPARRCGHGADHAGLVRYASLDDIDGIRPVRIVGTERGVRANPDSPVSPRLEDGEPSIACRLAAGGDRGLRALRRSCPRYRPQYRHVQNRQERRPTHEGGGAALGSPCHGHAQ